MQQGHSSSGPKSEGSGAGTTTFGNASRVQGERAKVKSLCSKRRWPEARCFARVGGGIMACVIQASRLFCRFPAMPRRIFGSPASPTESRGWAKSGTVSMWGGSSRERTGMGFWLRFAKKSLASASCFSPCWRIRGGSCLRRCMWPGGRSMLLLLRPLLFGRASEVWQSRTWKEEKSRENTALS